MVLFVELVLYLCWADWNCGPIYIEQIVLRNAYHSHKPNPCPVTHVCPWDVRIRNGWRPGIVVICDYIKLSDCIFTPYLISDVFQPYQINKFNLSYILKILLFDLSKYVPLIYNFKIIFILESKLCLSFLNK